MFTDEEYIAAIDKLMRETDKDQGYMLTPEFKYISRRVEEYENSIEFHSRTPEQIVLAIFDKLGVKLSYYQIMYRDW